MKKRTLIASNKGLAKITRNASGKFELVLTDNELKPVVFKTYPHKQNAVRYAMRNLS